MAPKSGLTNPKTVKKHPQFTKTSIWGEKKKNLWKKWMVLWKNNPHKKKKFFSKHPVAKKAKVFHVICLAKMADVLVSINFPTPSSKSWSWDFISNNIFPKNSVILWNREL